MIAAEAKNNQPEEMVQNDAYNDGFEPSSEDPDLPIQKTTRGKLKLGTKKSKDGFVY